ncbi:hypothetical protein HMPREF0454_03827 [Hafnia alvei ATCC 51873]|uniref:Uncharacterized protein n=1 Tax=Hafnia alvei ATCC 51873 TaxID=1002364 RepID=G9YB48_HAFAL|nr:hypothetical protein HMPREF0454_03827 [Hafnia alvei ATCC 51873]
MKVAASITICTYSYISKIFLLANNSIDQPLSNKIQIFGIIGLLDCRATILR